jgi:hypothetical protein
MDEQYKVYDCGQPPNEGASLSKATDDAIVSQSQLGVKAVFRPGADRLTGLRK